MWKQNRFLVYDGYRMEMMTNSDQLGKNSGIMQRQNRMLVLQLIRERGVTSRIELAALTGLKQATITNIVNELLEMDFIRETGLIGGNRGRRVKGLELNVDKMIIMVARVTTHYFAAGLYDLNGKCLRIEKTVWNTEKRPLRRLEMLSSHLEMLCETGRKPVGSCLVFPGNEYEIISPLKTDDTEAHREFLRDYFDQKLDLSFLIESMSNMSAYFAWNQMKRENRGKTGMLICLNISYSVDCAVIVEGEILRGAKGMTGNYGHVSIDMNGPSCECGNRGCINTYLSVNAVKGLCARMAGEYPQSRLQKESDIRDIITAYYDDDPLALELYRYVADKLGVSLTNLINQFEPDEIVLGDEIPIDDRFLSWITDGISRRTRGKYEGVVTVRIFQEKRKTENDVGMRGACLYVVDELLKDSRLIFDAKNKSHAV